MAKVEEVLCSCNIRKDTHISSNFFEQGYLAQGGRTITASEGRNCKCKIDGRRTFYPSRVIIG